MKKQLIAIPIGTLSWPIVVKLALYWAKFQIWIAELMFDTSGWESDDKLMWVLGGSLVSFMGWMCVMAWFEEKEKDEPKVQQS